MAKKSKSISQGCFFCTHPETALYHFSIPQALFAKYCELDHSYSLKHLTSHYHSLQRVRLSELIYLGDRHSYLAQYMLYNTSQSKLAGLLYHQNFTPSPSLINTDQYLFLAKNRIKKQQLSTLTVPFGDFSTFLKKNQEKEDVKKMRSKRTNLKQKNLQKKRVIKRNQSQAFLRLIKVMNRDKKAQKQQQFHCDVIYQSKPFDRLSLQKDLKELDKYTKRLSQRKILPANPQSLPPKKIIKLDKISPRPPADLNKLDIIKQFNSGNVKGPQHKSLPRLKSKETVPSKQELKLKKLKQIFSNYAPQILSKSMRKK